jgi:hypothetical protein
MNVPGPDHPPCSQPSQSANSEAGGIANPSQSTANADAAQ